MTPSPTRPPWHRHAGIGNYLRTGVLLAGLTALALAIGEWLGGPSGMVTALVLVGAMNFFSYWFSDRLALAMNQARPLPREDAPWLHELLESLCARAGLPVPRLYLIPTETPNAFATGRNPEHAAVAVTEGILRLLDRRELAGVLAHELSHVANRDTLISTVAATLAGAITQGVQLLFWAGGAFLRNRDDESEGVGGGLARLGLMLVAPFAAMLLQLAVSRSREYGADLSGAELTEDPDALADALSRLEEGVQQLPDDHAPATAHLFIVNPLSRQGLQSLFSTHPPLEERIRRLRALARAP